MTAALVVGSCSSSDRGGSASSSTTSAAVGSVAISGTIDSSAVTSTTATTRAGSSNPTIELTCGDAGSPSVPPAAQDPKASGLSFSGVADVHQRPTFELTTGSSGHPFQKIFLYVSTRAASQTRVTLTAPGDAYLYYVPARTWQSRQPDAKVLSTLAKTVTVSRCTTDLTGYFGGIVLGASACVTLKVEPLPSGTPNTLKLTLPGPC